MADIVNLKRARKDKERREHEHEAAANRLRFGRTKAQKAKARQDGKPNGGPRPFGWKATPVLDKNGQPVLTRKGKPKRTRRQNNYKQPNGIMSGSGMRWQVPRRRMPPLLSPRI